MGYRLAAFPVGSLLIRVLDKLLLQFFEVPSAFRGLGICLRLSGSRRFLSLPRCRTIWLAALGFRAFDSRLQQRTLATEPICFRKEQLFGVFEQFCQLPCGIHNLDFAYFVFQNNPWAVCSLSRPYGLLTLPRNLSKLFCCWFREGAFHCVSYFCSFYQQPLLRLHYLPHLLYFLAAQLACPLFCPCYFF